MPVTVTIKYESGSGGVAGTLTPDGIGEQATPRDLVRTRVRTGIRFIRLAQLAGG